ncbi:hypothetical protein WICPIJ_001171 [Wickerhamomyces pijperi]|uniref:DUF1746 domain-containing protein n=1 Tax=Wickerhamomyces pijperi TaxID=599730 RepID=A0A9P8QBH0_WICPI|nr:hypothetical protein WICPIJ_001171 [Wickerhamomyces pijperi]
MVLRYSPLLHGLFSSVSGKKSTFNLLILSTTFVIIFHLTTPLPKPNDDGFIYGHHTLQAIGQYQLSSKYWLLCYDLMIFFLQLTVFATQYSDKKSLHTKCTIRNSYDGFQGGINIIKIPVVGALKMKRATFEELKEDERMADQNNQRFTRQLESLINSNDGELETEGTGYGSINQGNSALGNF